MRDNPCDEHRQKESQRDSEHIGGCFSVAINHAQRRTTDIIGTRGKCGDDDEDDERAKIDVVHSC